MTKVQERKRSRLAAGILAGGMLLAWPLGAQLPDDWKIERFDATHELGRASAVEIRNDYGDVRCRVTDQSELYVVANIQRHQDDPRKAEVRIGEEGERITIEVVYPPPGDDEAAGITAEMEKRRADVSVLLPEGPRLAVETTDGLIEVKGLRTPLDASSRNGRMVVRTASTVRARSEHGALEVTFRTTDWDEPSSLLSDTGDIAVWLPPEAAILVEAETLGELSTDYSIEIERRGPADKKFAVARIGEGGGRLALRSEKGRIRVLRFRF
ncbi:MAG: hypothetical protein GY856_53890 [bacterium]|nr:hypothetical protein [bacterium]